MRRPSSRIRSCSARASVDLPLPERPVKKTTKPRSSSPGWSWSTIGGDLARATRPRRVTRQHLAGRVVGRHLLTQLVVVVGVAVGGQRCGDDVGRWCRRLEQRRPRRAWRGPGRRGRRPAACRCRSARAARRRARPPSPDQLEVLVGERRGDGDDQRSVVLLAGLGRASGAAAGTGRRRGVASGVSRLGGPAGRAAGPRGRPARPRGRRPAPAGRARVMPGSETSKVVRGASAPESSSSRSSSSRGLGQYCGAGTGQSCQTGRPDTVARMVCSRRRRRDRPLRVRRGPPLRVVGGAGPRRLGAAPAPVTCEGPMLPRSCNKPIQALGMLEAGLALERRAARAGLRLALG